MLTHTDDASKIWSHSFGRSDKNRLDDKSDRFFTLSKIKVRDIIKIIFIGFGVTEDRGKGNAYS